MTLIREIDKEEVLKLSSKILKIFQEEKSRIHIALLALADMLIISCKANDVDDYLFKEILNDILIEYCSTDLEKYHSSINDNLN